MPTDYTIPLEIAYGDVREIQFDDEVSAGMILEKLVGREEDPKDTGTYALLELVYDATNKLRELRRLEKEQPMYQLVPSVMAPKGSLERSELAIVNMANETVVFFNPYFRMLTGYPHEHLSFFPEEMMNVSEFEMMIKIKLGLHAKDVRFGLYGNYETHVARLESSVMVASLRRTLDTPELPRFFQFQVIPEHADQEILGVERSSWMYVKSHKGFHREHKLWCALKGTTLFMYKGESKKKGKVGSIDRIDECRVLNLGFNIPHTRYYVQLVHPNGHGYTLSSAYALRMKKWVKALTRCHRVMDSQMPVTAKSIAGISDPVVSKYSRRPSFVEPTPLVVANEPTEQQRKMLEKPEDILKLIKSDARSLVDKPDSTVSRQWLETLRLYFNTLMELKRPGFARSVLPALKEALKSISRFGLGLEDNGLKMASFQAVEDIVDQCERVFAIFKSHVLDEVDFPKDVLKEECKYVPRMQRIQSIFARSDYYLQDHFEDEQQQEQGRDQQEAEAAKEEEFSTLEYINNLRRVEEDDYAADDEEDGEGCDEETASEPEEMEMPEGIPQQKTPMMARVTKMFKRASVN